MRILVIQSGKHKEEGQTGRPRDHHRPRRRLPHPHRLVRRQPPAALSSSRRRTESSSADLGSRNGTFVDGVPIQGEVLLRPGGSLSVGPLSFELAGADATKKTAPPKAGLKKNSDPNLSDDDIAGWLAEEERCSAPTRPSSRRKTPTSRGRPPGTAARARLPQEEKRIQILAEEAADIIRRHRESLEESVKT